MNMELNNNFLSESQVFDNQGNFPNRNKDHFQEETKPLNNKKAFQNLKEKIISKDVKEIFNSDTQSKNTMKSLKKEVKINDTIVAIISSIIIVLCFFQLNELISADYKMTDIILTMRTAIIILSVPNSIHYLKQ
jgi:hypothetical protein